MVKDVLGREIKTPEELLINQRSTIAYIINTQIKIAADSKLKNDLSMYSLAITKAVSFLDTALHIGLVDTEYGEIFDNIYSLKKINL